jgi:hypothetical protein
MPSQTHESPKEPKEIQGKMALDFLGTCLDFGGGKGGVRDENRLR